MSLTRPLSFASLALALLTTSFAAPHGGVYRGPGSTVGPGPGGATAGGPSTGGAGSRNTDDANWETWWSLNRDLYLALKDKLYDSSTTTGSDDFYLGAGSRAGASGAGLRPTNELIQGTVVPALKAALEGQKDPDIVTGALLALAKIGDPPGARGESGLAPLIRAYLAHSNQEIHETAAIALGVLASPDAATLLVELIDDTSAGQALCGRGRVPVRTRAFAAYGLALVGHRAKSEAVRRFVVHHLARAARLEDISTRDLGVAAVIGIGLVRLADDEREPNTTGGDDEPASRPSESRQAQVLFLLDLLEDERVDARTRAYVPVALARLDRDAEPSQEDAIVARFAALVAKRSKADKILQQGVVHALGLIADDDDEASDVLARASLHGAIEHGDRLSRNLALLALARAAGRRGAGEPGVVAAETRAFLLERLSRGGSTERPWAGLGLGLLERGRMAAGKPGSDPDARRALLHALSGAGAPSEAGAYSIGLALMGATEATEELTERAASGDQNARGYAATALGLLGAREAAPVLRAIVKNERYTPGLVREAAIGLALMGDKQTVPDLLARLARATIMLDQVATASALGFVGDARTVEPLVALLADRRSSETTRAFAAVALGIVCDKEPYPWNSKLATDAGWWEAPVTLHDPLGGKGVLDLL